MLNVAMVVAIAILFFNCEDTTKPIVKPDGEDSTLVLNYNIYYPLSQSDGWRAEHSGLFFFSFANSTVSDRVLTESVVHVSSVGKNGTVVFQYEYLPNKFWVRYTDGTTLPIPFPQLDQSEKDYFYTTPPHIELSDDGNKAVFFATIKRLDGTKTEENKLMFLVVDLPATTYNIYDVSQFANSSLVSDNVNFVEVSGKFFFVNEDGSKVTFVVKGKNFNGGNFNDVGFYVFECNNGNFVKAFGKSSEKIELAGIDEKSDKLYAFFGNNLKIIKNSAVQNTSFTSENMSNPHQFAVSKSEVVLWTENGIALYNSDTETKIADIISLDSIKSLYPEVKKIVKSNKLSMSPDGGMIVFGFDKNTDPLSYDLFAVRRNGKDLKLLVPNTPVGIPVVSWGLK